MAQAQSSKCNNCLNADGTFFCYNCKKYLCLQCKSFHDNFTKGHSVIDSDKVDVAVFGINITCEKHNLEFSYQCVECDCLICASCVIEEHRIHEYKPIKDIATDKRSQLRDQKEEVISQKDLMSEMKTRVIEELYPKMEANAKILSNGYRKFWNKIEDAFHEESKHTREEVITTDEEKVQTCFSNFDTKQKECALRIKEIVKIESIKHDPTFLEMYKVLGRNEDGVQITTQLPEIKDISLAIQDFRNAFLERLDFRGGSFLESFYGMEEYFREIKKRCVRRLDTCLFDLEEHSKRVKHLESCLKKRNNDMNEGQEDLLNKYLVLERIVPYKEPPSTVTGLIIVAAIYIGNRSCCRWSFIYDPERFLLYNKWDTMELKPAMFCLDEHGQLESFGDTEYWYRQTEPNAYCFPTIEHLNKLKLDKDVIVEDIQGKRMLAKDLISLIMRFHVTALVKMPGVCANEILWVITGPLMSKDSENLIKEAALSAGIPEEQLYLCIEREAILRYPKLLSKQTELSACDDEDSMLIVFHDFTDVFVYSKDSEDEIHKIRRYHMETVGTKIVVDVVLDLLQKITGFVSVSEFDSLDAFDLFRNIKSLVQKLDCTSKHLIFRLFMPTLERTNKQADTFIREAVEKGEIKFINDKVKIQKSIFEPTLKKQSELFVSFLTEVFDNSNISTVYLLGNNNLLKSTFTENFPKKKTLVENGDVEILQSVGAVCCGHTWRKEAIMNFLFKW